MNDSKDRLGDRLKAMESTYGSISVKPSEHLYVRLDGRSFSRFTRSFDKPFDVDMHSLMLNVTTALAVENSVTLAYFQSDEISLAWRPRVSEAFQHMFDGKVQKLCSVLASQAGSLMMYYMLKEQLHPSRAEFHPHFDARVVGFESDEDLIDMFAWRAKDAQRNAVSSAACTVASHKLLQNLKSSQKLEVIANAGVDFEAYPASFRFGTFIVPVKRSVPASIDIPEQFRPASGFVERSFYEPHFIPETKYAAIKDQIRSVYLKPRSGE